MRHLNYNHLLYFWTVAREGSIGRAAASLHLTPQTISGQLKLLDTAVGEALFQRAGRGLTLTPTGHLVKQYADEIFALGAELAHLVRGGGTSRASVLNVGIVNTIPKLITYRILRPALESGEPLRIACYEADLEKLLSDLAVHRLDLVLSDRPIPGGFNVKAYNHGLGDSEVGFFAHKDLAARYVNGFPASLRDAPLLLPLRTTAVRRALDEWFDRLGVLPRIVAEFDDSALLKSFGAVGIGVFPAPLAIAKEVERMYEARMIGVADGIKESYFAVSPERRLKHPAVLLITAAAREALHQSAAGSQQRTSSTRRRHS
jgi:LysR family transcriptional regulator, transcriptional activator of nhaA